MAGAILQVCLGVAALATWIRVVWCIAGFVRMFRNHARAEVSHWGLVQAAVVPEAYLLGIAALFLWSEPAAPTAAALAFACLGALLSVAELAISVWTFLSFPSIGTGHYVAKGQALVLQGPYAWVRHPTYLGVLLLWFGLAVAYRSIAALLVACFYTAIYAVYARREETMMSAAFGEVYDDYCDRVGRLVPRNWPPSRGRAEP
jgi:protein-S-isoprenylcysteine O-methyltransferase Ste14